ncbi:TerD family protein [Fusobacterium sp. PH5-44]|uniref:TerD family protein n=1 Tax=unclassified Fusobacterium TaxID=2648384 RepID=UPI003D19DF34
MSFNLKKDQKFNLSKGKRNLNKLLITASWDISDKEGMEYDLDATAFLLGSNNLSPTQEDFIFYGNLIHRSGSVEHMGDSLPGDKGGKYEQMKVDLSIVPPNIKKIAFTVSIYDADARKQNFGYIINSSIKIINETTNEEILNFDLENDFSVETAIIAGELVREEDGWKFNALGQGYYGGLAGLCKKFGIEAE